MHSWGRPQTACSASCQDRANPGLLCTNVPTSKMRDSSLSESCADVNAFSLRSTELCPDRNPWGFADRYRSNGPKRKRCQFPTRPTESIGLGLKPFILKAKGTDFAGYLTFYLERDTRPPTDALAERIPALARRDLLWKACGDALGKGYPGLCLDLPLGVARVPGLGCNVGPGSAETVFQPGLTRLKILFGAGNWRLGAQPSTSMKKPAADDLPQARL